MIGNNRSVFFWFIPQGGVSIIFNIFSVMEKITIDGPFQIYKSLCTYCRHFDMDKLTCPAYPSGIPEDLLSGKNRHEQVRSDQTGSIVFESE
jgi:hypothetical protein